MRRVKPAALALTVAGFVAWSGVVAGQDLPRHGRHGTHAGGAQGGTCKATVAISEDAEHQPGGAFFAGPVTPHHRHHQDSKAAMKGAHMDHTAKHGGAFFMAPNKIHHLEAVFSEACGFRLFLYNAFTRPIHVERFRAFIVVVPSRDDEAEMIRFLSPNGESSVLAAGIAPLPTRPFTIRLHLKFPETDEPEVFTVRVPAAARK